MADLQKLFAKQSRLNIMLNIFLVSFHPRKSPIHQQGQSVTRQISACTFVTCDVRVQTLRSAQQFLQWRSFSTWRNCHWEATEQELTVLPAERPPSQYHRTGVLPVAVLITSWQEGEQWNVTFEVQNFDYKELQDFISLSKGVRAPDHIWLQWLTKWGTGKTWS